MDILEFKNELDTYFKQLTVDYHNEIIEENGLKFAALTSHIYLKPLGDLKIHLNVLGYENGTCQINFNFGRVKLDSELLALILKFNIKCFAFKPVIEYDELRFYSQGFYPDAKAFIYNLDKCLQMFLSEDNLKRLKEMTKFLEK